MSKRLTMRLFSVCPMNGTLAAGGGNIKHTPVRPSDRYEGLSIDVRAFGAKGDGATDDTAAIRAAVQAAFERRRVPQHSEYGYFGTGLPEPHNLTFPLTHKEPPMKCMFVCQSVRLVLVALTALCLSSDVLIAAAWDPAAPDYSGHKGKTFYVSKLGDNSDGSSWPKAFRTIQAALLAVPDDQGGHQVIVRPDTYVEAPYDQGQGPGLCAVQTAGAAGLRAFVALARGALRPDCTAEEPAAHSDGQVTLNRCRQTKQEDGHG